MGFIENKVERQIRFFDCVLDDVPDREGPHVRHDPELAAIVACAAVA